MLLLLGAITRLAFLAWGSWQDSRLAVRYTDIDYLVVTDGARFVLQGRSPYERSTYRYSPLLAYLMAPNVALHGACGKLLFCAADLLAARLLQALLARDASTSQRLRSACVALWLFNPLTATISTRGSGEAVVACLLLALLLLLQRGLPVAAGLVFGLAVHYRLYPIIYALPILLHLGNPAAAPAAARGTASSSNPGGEGSTPTTTTTTTRQGGTGPAALRTLLSPHSAAFGLAAAGVFLGLGGLFYRLYGPAFLQETYLYHATRVDPRHNFSPFFYPAYLAIGGGPVAAPSVGWAFTAAQAALQLGLAVRLAGDLPLCLLLQTMALVAFNKVSTAQYFCWYLTFLPLVLPRLLRAPNRWRLAAATLAWVAAMGHWLRWAYLLEFQAASGYLPVWAASLVFLAAHVWVIQELLHAGTQAPGKLKAQ